MDLDSWNSLLKVGLFVGGICGVGALITETMISSRQESLIRQLTRDTADAKRLQAEAEIRLRGVEAESARQQERAAKAELSLLEVQRAMEPRSVRFNAASGLIVESLKSGPKLPESEVVSIWYHPNDAEAFGLAGAIERVLRESGWRSSTPQPIPPDAVFADFLPESVDHLPSAGRTGGAVVGVSILHTPMTDERSLGFLATHPAAVTRLAEAFTATLGHTRMVIGLPRGANGVLIVVGPKP
jgi:hypothetical protein